MAFLFSFLLFLCCMEQESVVGEDELRELRETKAAAEQLYVALPLNHRIENPDWMHSSS